MFYKSLNHKNLITTFGLVMIVLMASCTDLTEEVDSEVTADNFFQTEEEFISALGDAYGTLTGIHGGGFSQVNEVTTDEIQIPARGQDWFENGFWFRVNTHTWTPEEFNGAWTFMFSGVNAANRLIFQFQSAVEAGAAEPSLADPIISELQALRAFYYLNLLDVYGNVPIITSFEDAPENPNQPSADFQQGRQEVFNFVEQELLNSIPLLNEDVGSTYGRMNKFVAYMALAKLYLNAEVYTGTPRWQDAVTQLNAVIDSGNYNLAANYLDNFVIDNSGSPENMFVVPYDEVFLPGFSLHHMTLHYASQATYNFQGQPWNGWSGSQKLYENYIDPAQNPGPQAEVFGVMPTSDDLGLERVQGTNDDRLGNLLVGPQFSSAGVRLEDDGVVELEADLNGPPLTFTPFINDLQFSGCRQCGARIGKYEFESGISTNMSNDYVIYRYADVLLMKAEALWRMNPGSAEALMLVNTVRARSGVDGFDSLDADKLLAERMREMFYELTRRQDLIRFAGDEGPTEYNDSWKFKDVSPETRNVMPIPQVQLETNPNLVQNPGY